MVINEKYKKKINIFKDDLLELEENVDKRLKNKAFNIFHFITN